MTNEPTAPKKKRSRRGRRRRGGGAAIQPPQAQQPTQAPAPAPASEDQGYDLAKEAAEMRADQAKQAETFDRANEICLELIPLILKGRDQETLNWICAVTGGTPVKVMTSILRTAIVRERRNQREALGGGGMSSTNIEKLKDRIG